MCFSRSNSLLSLLCSVAFVMITGHILIGLLGDTCIVMKIFNSFCLVRNWKPYSLSSEIWKEVNIIIADLFCCKSYICSKQEYFWFNIAHYISIHTFPNITKPFDHKLYIYSGEYRLWKKKERRWATQREMQCKCFHFILMLVNTYSSAFINLFKLII